MMASSQVLILIWTLLCQATIHAIAKPRNVIWMLNDQENNRQWFPPGWEKANLPLLSKLQKHGIKFKNAFTNANMCSSARASMFTGHYPAAHQLTLTLTSENYQSPWESQLHPKMWNAASIMKDNGYDVVYFGKWHMSKGYFNITTGEYIHDNIARYGFGTLDGNNQWNGEPPLGTRGVGGFGSGKSDLDHWAVTNSTAWIERRLKAQAAGTATKPFFLIVSIWNPHDTPISYPGVQPNRTDFTKPNTTQTPKYIIGGYLPNITNPTFPPIAVPPTHNETLPILNTTTGKFIYNNQTSIKPPLESWYLFGNTLGLGPCIELSCKQAFVNMYAQTIILSDMRFNQFYEAVMALPGGPGLINDTIIMKTSDHGEMQMAHGGQRQKPFMAYRESLGVNLVWSNPVLWPKGIETEALVSHVDHLPTMLDYLGIKAEKYGLPGTSYKVLFTKPEATVQTEVLFAFNDHWATFGEIMPPALNQVTNVDSFPIANVSNGAMPGPANIWVMNTMTHTVGLYYDEQAQPAPEVDVCYDNTPNGGDYDAFHKAPLQLVNLSPWAERVRKAWGIPSAGTAAQLSKCANLLAKLRRKTAAAFKPFPRYKIVQPQNVKMRYFTNTSFCTDQCVEVLFWSQIGQNYYVKANVKQGPFGDPVDTFLPNMLMTVGDMDGLPYAIHNFPQYVPGNNGPVYFVANVPIGTVGGVKLLTMSTMQRAADPNYRGETPLPPGCLEGCEWTNITKTDPFVIDSVMQQFSHQH